MIPTGYIYICRREHSTTGLLKIGHTDNLERRMSDFDRETGADSRMVIEYAFACDARHRELVERRTHRIARQHRRRGEWFELDLPDAIRFVQKAAEIVHVPLTVAHNNAEATVEACLRRLDELGRQYDLLQSTPLAVDTRDADRKRNMAYAAKRATEIERAASVGFEKWAGFGIIPVPIVAGFFGNIPQSGGASIVVFGLAAAAATWVWRTGLAAHFKGKAEAAHKETKDAAIEAAHAAAVEALAVPVRTARAAELAAIEAAAEDINCDLFDAEEAVRLAGYECDLLGNPLVCN